MSVPLPPELVEVRAATQFISNHQKWLTNEELASLLVAFPQHEAWITQQPPRRPQSGSVLLLDRTLTKGWKDDGYAWKKRRLGRKAREDHMKLKVSSSECLGALYVHSEMLSSFHRRSYWLLARPDVILVHYLNVLTQADTISLTAPLISVPLTREYLEQQLYPMFRISSGAAASSSLYYAALERVIPQLLGQSNASPISCSCDVGDESSERPPSLSDSPDSLFTSSLDFPVMTQLTMQEVDSILRPDTSDSSTQTTVQPPQLGSFIRIRDFAPQSVFLMGGVRVLIAGHWPDEQSTYTVEFGTISVPAVLLQQGLIKCYCPQVSSPGGVELRVLCNGLVVSNACTFLYRRAQSASSRMSQPLTESQHARLLLLEALDSLKSKTGGGACSVTALPCRDLTETLAVSITSQLSAELVAEAAAGEYSLAHLGAVLGYSQLVSLLTCGLDRVDGDGNTALHLAAAAGSRTVALQLASTSLPLVTLTNNEGFTPAGLAAINGHFDLVAQLQQLEGDATDWPRPASPIFNLANQIIAALPDHIKESSQSADDSGVSTPAASVNTSFDAEPYYGSCSSGSTSPSLLFQIDSPPPTQQEFSEYFHLPSCALQKNLAQLTLSDAEQRRLYSAARVIQQAYRRYRDRTAESQQQQREGEAALCIQSYYRRYKHYLAFKKQISAAVRIQSQYRSYRQQKRFRQSREAAMVIQNQFRQYRATSRQSGQVMTHQRFRLHYQRSAEQPQAAGETSARISEWIGTSSSNSRWSPSLAWPSRQVSTTDWVSPRARATSVTSRGWSNVLPSSHHRSSLPTSLIRTSSFSGCEAATGPFYPYSELSENSYESLLQHPHQPPYGFPGDDVFN